MYWFWEHSYIMLVEERKAESSTHQKLPQIMETNNHPNLKHEWNPDGSKFGPNNWITVCYYAVQWWLLATSLLLLMTINDLMMNEGLSQSVKCVRHWNSVGQQVTQYWLWISELVLWCKGCHFYQSLQLRYVTLSWSLFKLVSKTKLQQLDEG